MDSYPPCFCVGVNCYIIMLHLVFKNVFLTQKAALVQSKVHDTIQQQKPSIEQAGWSLCSK